MMGSLTLARIRRRLFRWILGAAIGGIAVWLALVSSTMVDPYWLDVSSKATITMLVLGPACAVRGALEGARWRSGGFEKMCSRSRVEFGVRQLGPVLLWAIATVAVALVVIAWRSDVAPGQPYWPLLGATALAISSYCAAGFLLGTWLPPLYTVPSSFALVWLWLAYPPTLTPYWLRNVNGNLGASCCSMRDVLAPGAVLAPTLISVGLLAAVALLIQGSQRPTRRVLTAVAAVAVLAAAVGQARTLMLPEGTDPVRSRVTAMVCDGTDPVVCAWPEHAAGLASGRREVQLVVDRLEAAGVSPPKVVTEADVYDARTWVVSLNPAATAAERQDSMALAPLLRFPPGCSNEHGGRWPAGDSLEVLREWLQTSAGLTPDGTGPEIRAAVRRLRASPRATQQRWYEATLRALPSCTTPAPPLP